MRVQVDEDGDGTIDFDEFLAMMAKKLKSSDSPEELLQAFQVFEYQDMEGSMPVEELRYVLENLAEELNGMEVEYMMKKVRAKGVCRTAMRCEVTLLTPRPTQRRRGT